MAAESASLIITSEPAERENLEKACFLCRLCMQRWESCMCTVSLA
jgi:hypothetical protein